MKPKRIMVMAVISTILLLILFSVLFLAPTLFPHFYAKRSANIFFNSLVDGDFNKASEQIYYVDADTDLRSTISDKDAKKIWVDRVTRLKREGTYVKSYSNLRTWMFKGRPQGEVVIIAVKNKQEFSCRIAIFFIQADDKWRIRFMGRRGSSQDIVNLMQALSEDIKIK